MIFQQKHLKTIQNNVKLTPFGKHTSFGNIQTLHPVFKIVDNSIFGFASLFLVKFIKTQSNKGRRCKLVSN